MKLINSDILCEEEQEKNRIEQNTYNPFLHLHMQGKMDKQAEYNIFDEYRIPYRIRY